MTDTRGFLIAAVAATAAFSSQPARAQEWASHLGKPTKEVVERVKTVGNCEAPINSRFSLPGHAPFKAEVAEGSSLENPFGAPGVSRDMTASLSIWTQECRIDKATSLIIHSSHDEIYKIELFRHGCRGECDFDGDAADVAYIALLPTKDMIVIYPYEDRSTSDIDRLKTSESEIFKGEFAPMLSRDFDDGVSIDREIGSSRQSMVIQTAGNRVTTSIIAEVWDGWFWEEPKRYVARQTFLDVAIAETATRRLWDDALKAAAELNAVANKESEKKAAADAMVGTFR